MTHRNILRLLSVSLLLLPVLLVTEGTEAANPVQMQIDAGVTEVEIEGHQIRIETTGDIIVSFYIDGDIIEGEVENAPGTRTSTVTITVLGDPDRVIFSGRVVGMKAFREYIPHETGQGEM